MKSPRPAARRVDLTKVRTGKRDKYDTIVDRLGAMADKEDRRAGCNAGIEQITVCALRGFGTHKVVLGSGTYGPELEACLRRQARSKKDHLWRIKCKVPISNRIAKAAASGRFGKSPWRRG